MAINLMKAIVEHGCKEEVSWLNLDFKGPAAPYRVSMTYGQHQGDRAHMEDYQFTIEAKEYYLAGVFDGHRGSYVAWFCASEIPLLFEELWKKDHSDVEKILKRVHSIIDKNLSQSKSGWSVGSTGVLVCLPKKSKKGYVLNIGDSEAKKYTKEGECIVSMPLCPVRRPDSVKDRAEILQLGGKIFYDEAKIARNPNRLALSRTFGNHDDYYILRKPKLSIFPIQPGLIIVGSDGLFDFRVPARAYLGVSEREAEAAFIKDCLLPHFDEAELASKIIEHIIFQMSGRDNITVVTIRIY